MIKKCLQQWAKHEHDYILSPLDRVLLTLKAIIAILLRLEMQEKIDIYEGNYVKIAMTDGGTYSCEWGTCGWYEALMISKNWNEWRFVVYQDGWP